MNKDKKSKKNIDISKMSKTEIMFLATNLFTDDFMSDGRPKQLPIRQIKI